MLKCWQLSTNDRPTFAEIRNHLSNILERYYDDYYLLLDRQCDYYNFTSSKSQSSSNEFDTILQIEIDQNLINRKIDINIRNQDNSTTHFEEQFECKSLIVNNVE
jgi:hypothetical protein